MNRKHLALIRIHSNANSRLHMVDRDQFFIGRSSESHIMLAEPSVSRKHALVEISGAEIFITDLSSSNGLFFGEKRMAPDIRHYVAPGMEVRLGKSLEILKFELMDRPIEFTQYQDLLPQFNVELENVAENMLNEVESRVKKEVEAAKHQRLIKVNAEIDQMRQREGQEVDQLKRKALAEIEHMRQKVAAEIEQMKQGEVQALQIRIEQEITNQREQIREDLSDYRNEVKADAVTEADEILMQAHNEVLQLRVDYAEEYKKQLDETQKKSAEIVKQAEEKAEKLMQQARDMNDKFREKTRKEQEELLEKARLHNAESMANAQKEATTILESAKVSAEKDAAISIEYVKNEIKRMKQDAKEEIKAKKKEHSAFFKESEQLQKDLEKLRLEKSTLIDSIHEKEQELKRLIEEKTFELDKLTEEKASELKRMTEEKTSELNALTRERTDELNARIRETTLELDKLIKEKTSELKALTHENERQSDLNKQLEKLNDEIKQLDVRKVQMQEEGARNESRVADLHKQRIEELDKACAAKEKQLENAIALKARSITQKVERTILKDIAEKWPESKKHLSEISRKITDDLMGILVEDNFDKTAKIEKSVGLKFFHTRAFRWGAVVGLVAVFGALYQNSKEEVTTQQQFTEKLIEKQKEDARFKPQMNEEYRNTYTDNIVFNLNYLNLKMDEKIQNQWALNLNDFFLKKLRLSEEDMVRFIGLESAMIKRLVTLRDAIDARSLEEGMQRMRDAEKEDTEGIMRILQTEKNYQKLRDHERQFLVDMRAQPEQRTPAKVDP